MAATSNCNTNIADTAPPDHKWHAMDDVPIDSANITDDDASDKKIEDLLDNMPHNRITSITVPNGSHAHASSLNTTPSFTSSQHSSSSDHVSPIHTGVDLMDLSHDEDQPPALQPEDLYTIMDMN